jgi:hypothetical protein
LDPYNVGLRVRRKGTRRKPLVDTSSVHDQVKVSLPAAPNQPARSMCEMREYIIMSNLKRRKSGSKVERLSVYNETLFKSLPSSATDDDKCNLLQHCKRFWTDCLEHWFSYVVFRSVGKSFDTYWIPPRSDNRITLRSASEILRYVNHAIDITEKCASSRINFETINDSWVFKTRKKPK